MVIRHETPSNLTEVNRTETNRGTNKAENKKGCVRLKMRKKKKKTTRTTEMVT